MGEAGTDVRASRLRRLSSLSGSKRVRRACHSRSRVLGVAQAGAGGGGVLVVDEDGDVAAEEVELQLVVGQRGHDCLVVKGASDVGPGWVPSAGAPACAPPASPSSNQPPSSPAAPEPPAPPGATVAPDGRGLPRGVGVLAQPDHGDPGGQEHGGGTGRHPPAPAGHPVGDGGDGGGPPWPHLIRPPESRT